MNPYFKMLIVLAAGAGLLAPATAIAQKSVGGVVGEARLHPGTWDTQRSFRSGMRSRSMYRSTAPVIVRGESAPNAIAQAPTEQRSFSYEPSQQSQLGHCEDSVTTEQGPATAQRSTESRRSFSYEPSTRDSYVAPRSFSAPRMRSSRSSRLPRFLGPKEERNNYRN